MWQKQDNQKYEIVTVLGVAVTVLGETVTVLRSNIFGAIARATGNFITQARQSTGFNPLSRASGGFSPLARQSTQFAVVGAGVEESEQMDSTTWLMDDTNPMDSTHR